MNKIFLTIMLFICPQFLFAIEKPTIYLALGDFGPNVYGKEPLAKRIINRHLTDIA